jgi:hypothetical protein
MRAPPLFLPYTRCHATRPPPLPAASPPPARARALLDPPSCSPPRGTLNRDTPFPFPLRSDEKKPSRAPFVADPVSRAIRPPEAPHRSPLDLAMPFVPVPPPKCHQRRLSTAAYGELRPPELLIVV